MLKRKMLKRALPVILSVAMTLQSVPVTAMAAENQVVEETGQVESTEDTSGSDTVKDAGASDVVSDEERSDASGDESISAEDESVQKDEGSIDAAEAAEASETEIVTEDAEEETPSQTKEKFVARIIVDDKKIDEYAKADNGFTRILGEEGLVFFTEYVDESQCGRFQEAVKGCISVEVDGEHIDTLKDRLTFNWVRKAESGEGTGTPLVNAIPTDAGEYELTISMDLANLDGVCKKLESDVKLSLTIEKANIGLVFDRGIAPGKTAGDLIDKINENYTIKYQNRIHTVNRDILDIRDAGGNADPDKKLPLSIFMLDNGGNREQMAETDRFDRTKDYVLTIGVIPLTANAAKNYELFVDDSYMITVGERQKTEIRFERKEPGRDLIEVYDSEKSWSIADVTESLFIEDVKDAEGNVTQKGGTPAVYIKGKDDEKKGEYSVLLEEAVLEAGWYARSRVNAYNADTDAGEIMSDDRNYVYKPMTADPKDAGEYFIIWSYAGDDSAYEKSHSEAVRFTIDPVAVVIKTDQESVDNAGFSDDMNGDDVRKALAKLSYGVYPIVKNETTGELEADSTAIATTPDFFGTSYRGDVEADVTQYYVPEFVLQRRVTKITEKGEASAAVDPKAVKWETTESIKVIIDKEKDETDFNNIKSAELPNDVSKTNLEAVEFEFRVFFTGQKVVYDRDGNKVNARSVSITDVTTSAANRNYLADITNKTLEDTAVMVDVKTAESVQISTDAIVDAFIEGNRDMLYPQPGEGEADRDIHKGTLENPAVKIYDQNTLFKDRASYKQAKVHKYSEDGGIGEELPISSTDESLRYRWSYATLDKYEEYLEKWDEVQRQYKDFSDYQINTILGMTDMTDGTLASFRSAGLYRLTVTYNDPEHEYKSARAEVFFKVERQEIIIVPTEKYAKTGENINNWKNRLSKKNGEDFTIYKLPHNSMEEYNALADESKKDYELPTEAAITEFEANNGNMPNMVLASLEWQVHRKVKDSKTGEDISEWTEVDGGNFDDDFTYGLVAHWTGNLTGLESENWWENYTTKDIKTFRETGEDKHHEAVGDIIFYTQQIYAEVDAEKIKALGHEYNGDPVSLEKVAEALTFYTDEALTAGSKLPTETILNTTDEYDPEKINIYWTKDGNNYANKNAVYGGTYTLLLRFAGGGLKAAEDAPESADNIIYAPGVTTYYVNVNVNNEVNGTFTITPREITITPGTMSADLLAAGMKADGLLTNSLTLDDNVVETDKRFFDYMEIAAGGFDVTWIGSNTDGTDAEGSAYQFNINRNGGYPAFNGAARYIIQVNGREIKDPANEYLRCNSTYTVKLTNELASPLKESYRVTYGTAEVKIEKRGNADAATIAGEINGLSAGGIVYELNGSTYTVKPRGAVRFYANNVWGIGRDGAEALTNTNILGFRIYAPKEFLNNTNESEKKFVYQNAVWNAGGYFLGNVDWRTAWFEGEGRRYIDVVFPLTKEDAVRSFNITWEDGYTETFTLADIVLEEDLTKAVAPKSIKFNGVSGKMAVGEKQQLDLKITKAQLGDVIAVRYRIKGGETRNEYISLDPETGVVTALKVSKKATVVEAYPVYQNAKGDFVPVLDKKGKEAKAASTSITVTEVTASNVKKIIAQGGRAKLYFTVPDNGYRREIYVVDVTKGTTYESRKKWKPADFNKAIDNMVNGEWENAGFAIQPVYSYAKNDNLDDKETKGEYDKKLKAHITTIFNLETEHEYVVYVRNVSAARSLDDGSVVALSASGAVKKFKTIKPQVQGLELDFTIKSGEKDKKNTVTHPVNADGTINVNRYTVELSAGKAQLNVYGRFSDKAGGNDAAEAVDQRRYSLVPTLKEEKNALKHYQMPKLEYVVHDGAQGLPFDPDLVQSKYATISKKGLISLKGVDLNGEKTIFIYVRDGMQHQENFTADAVIELTITAKPASVTGKKVKMKVGQELRLSDYLEYKDAKKKKIADYRSSHVMITKEMIAQAEASGYRIVDRGADQMTHDWYITALSPNKAKFDLVVTDFNAEGNPMEAKLSLTSTQIDPVKGLKVTYVDDQSITITFTHPSNINENDDGSVYSYALEVKDARGNVLEKIVISNPAIVADIDGVDAKELKRVQSWFQHTGTAVWIPNPLDPKHKSLNVNNANPIGFNYYTGTHAKTKTFAYTYMNPELVRLSSYTISVTPLFENQKANKAVMVKTRTTNDPACDGDVDITGAVPDKLGGHVIQITSSGRQTAVNGGPAGAAPVTAPYRLISGNTYTLELVPDDAAARDRATDTLTWKSSNTKVASIKANAGTYTAAFKALNQGRTTITVTSKVTKKVIARWAVTVYAVKDGRSYGGDYEPTWALGFYENILALYDPFYEGRLEVLSMDVPLVIDNKDADGNDNDNVRTWISFTAPHYGQYTFNRVINNFHDSRNGNIIGTNTNTLFLEANQKVYFSVEGDATLSVSGTELARLEKVHTMDAPLEVKAGYVSFTAWEDNVYTFWHNGSKLVIDGRTETGMNTGETKFIRVNDGKMYVTWHEEVAEEELKLGSHPTGTVNLDKDNQVRYISFTANAKGTYKFTYKEVDGVAIRFIAADGGSLNTVYDSDTINAADETFKSFKLEEGDKVVIEFKAVPEITDAAKKLSASVKVTAEQRRKLVNSTITIPKGTTEIVEYVIPAFTTEKAKFKFAVSGEDGTKIIRYWNKDYQQINLNGHVLVVPDNYGIKPGDSIYIMVEAGGAADDNEAKDAVLTVTQVSVDTIKAGVEKTKEVTNDTEQWYIFTALEDGYYEFGVTVAGRPEGDDTPTHEARLSFYNELFGNLWDNNITTRILYMKTDEMLAIKLDSGFVYVPDIVKDDGTTETVKSNAAVSVKKLTILPLVLGEEKAANVQIPAKSKEVRYYSFTASVGADYTISWQPASYIDNARVTYFSQMTYQTGAQTVAAKGSSIRLETGEVRYIKVEIIDLESDEPANGKLCVTAANFNADVITAGKPYSFHLEDKDGEGVQKIVKFTAPESGNYSFVTEVKENPVNGLPYEYPTIKTGNTGIATPYDLIQFRKGETKYFTLSFNANGEVKETEGTITIRSLAEPFTGEQVDVSVEKEIVKEYTYVIPESGRYEFTADYDKEKASVQWQDANGNTLRDGNYYQKNTNVRVYITGLDEEAGASVKLYKPKLITTTALKAGGNKIEVNAGETKYYELSVGSKPKIYEFELLEITGSATASMMRVIDNGNSWLTLPDGGTLSMPKNSRLIIKIKSGSENKGVDCKLNITERKELTLGGNAVHLEAGESVNLTYRASETGYYSFNVNAPGKELALETYQATSWVTQIGDSFYDIAKLAAKDTRTYKLTNEASSAVDITVTMNMVEPIALEPGSKTSAKTIPAGQKAYYALKTFKNAEYLIKITDTSKGVDLKVNLDGADVTGELKKIADSVLLEKNLNGESLLCITNDGINDTIVTVELKMSEAQPLTGEAITLAKNESRLISFVATEDTRYLITRDNEDVTMTLVSEQKINGTEIKKNEDVNIFSERLLNKGDKLIYQLSYTPDAADEKAKESQTVRVKIEKIVPTTIKAESTPVTIAEKGNKSIWYQFTAQKDAIHTFVLEDAYGNEVPYRMFFQRYFTDTGYETNAERHMKAGRKVYINVIYPDAGSYTLKYTTVEAITETGARTLDFEYSGEVQEVKFVVPKGGIYKISATAIRGGFTVAGKIGNQTVVNQFSTNGGTKSSLLMKDDIVTFTLRATQAGNTSVTLRITEDSVADTLTLGKEHAGVSDTEKDIYYEIRIGKKALYAITASGEPSVQYFVNDRTIGYTLNGTEYKEFNKDDRIVIKVGKTATEKAYSVKIEEVSVASLDGKNTEEEPYSASEGDNCYSFTTRKAYVQYKVPEDGKYYIAVQTMNNNTVYDGMVIETPDETPAPAARAAWDQAGIMTLEKDQIVTFTFTNSDPKDDEDPAKEYKEALFKLIIKKAAADEIPINVGETKTDSLAVNETVSYQFKAAEAGIYVISFKGSNCTLNDSWDESTERILEKDETLTLTVTNNSGSKAGSYELKVVKVSPEALSLGVTAQKTLGKGEAAYYEFASTETTDDGETTYQVYISGDGVQYSCKKVDAEGMESNIYGTHTNYNHEVTLKKGEKLAFTVKNNSTTMNRGFKLTVKKSDYIPVKADIPVSGTLEAYENAYYEFTSEDESEDGTTYQVSIYGDDSVQIQRLKTAKWEKDSEGNDKLGTPTTVSVDQSEVTLKKGEKLLITAANNSGKTAQFELTVEKKKVETITYAPIALDEKKTGKLAENERAGYEFTADDASEEGTLYSVYFSGMACSYSRIVKVTDTEGKTTEEVVSSGSLQSGSNELTWNKGDKIRFTVSGTGKYELTVKKVTYVLVTAGTAVTKALNARETAYYQFTSQDDPAAGETETKYQVYGSFSGITVQTRTVTVGEDGNTTETGWSNKRDEYDLQKGQILQFKVTNSNAVSQLKLTIKKVEYSPMTLDKAAEGRLDPANSGYAYYEFISQDDPAEGQTTTTYQVYGTAYYYCSKVTVNEDNTLTSSGWQYKYEAMKVALAKGEHLRFRVSGSSKLGEGYNLTVAKTEEKTIAVGSKNETGSLGRGQELVYTLKYDKETPITYTLSYKQVNDVDVSVSVNDATVTDEQRIHMTKDDILKIIVTADDEADNFEFTISEFKPETITPGTMTTLKKLALSEKVYYQYTAGEDGSYVLSMVESEFGSLTLGYEVIRADAVVKNVAISGGVGEIELNKDDVLLINVSAPNTKAAAAYSFKLMLQKKTDEEAMTALPWNGTLKQGEVKYFKFTIPEEEKASLTQYTVSIPYIANTLKYTYNGSPIPVWNSYYNRDTYNDFVLRVANLSMYSEEECYFDVQKNPYVYLGGSSKEGTIAKGQTEYYKYTPGSVGDYVLEYNGDAKVQYSTDDTATKTWKNISDTEKRKITLTYSVSTIYLMISHNGAEETAQYKVSIE